MWVVQSLLPVQDQHHCQSWKKRSSYHPFFLIYKDEVRGSQRPAIVIYTFLALLVLERDFQVMAEIKLRNIVSQFQYLEYMYTYKYFQ